MNNALTRNSVETRIHVSPSHCDETQSEYIVCAVIKVIHIYEAKPDLHYKMNHKGIVRILTYDNGVKTHVLSAL